MGSLSKLKQVQPAQILDVTQKRRGERRRLDHVLGDAPWIQRQGHRQQAPCVNGAWESSPLGRGDRTPPITAKASWGPTGPGVNSSIAGSQTRGLQGRDQCGEEALRTSEKVAISCYNCYNTDIIL